MDTKRVGFVGFGFIGKVHATGYINLPLYYESLPFQPVLSHVCTSRMETARAGADSISAPHATTDFREITENPDIDIVHICTPNNVHKEAILSAIAHGKNIYCDKPLSSTMDEALEIRDALGTYNATAQMTLQNRFYPATIRARQLINQGFLGKVLEYRCVYLHSGSADPRAPLKWKLSSEAGGGVIADLASHVLDLMNYLLGDYKRLTAATSIAYSERPSLEDANIMKSVEAEDSVMLLAEMESGALGHIQATKLATGSEDEVRFEIHGSNGAIRFNGMNPNRLEVWNQKADGSPVGGFRGWTHIECGQRYPEPATGFPTPKAAMGWMRTHMACLANFLFDVAHGKPGNPGLEQGIYIQKLMSACRESASKRIWVDIER